MVTDLSNTPHCLPDPQAWLSLCRGRLRGSARLLNMHASDEDKDLFFDQLLSAINSVSQHDQLILIGDFNAVTGRYRTGFEQVVGNHGSETPNDNSLRLLTFCAAHSAHGFSAAISTDLHGS